MACIRNTLLALILVFVGCTTNTEEKEDAQISHFYHTVPQEVLTDLENITVDAHSLFYKRETIVGGAALYLAGKSQYLEFFSPESMEPMGWDVPLGLTGFEVALSDTVDLGTLKDTLERSMNLPFAINPQPEMGRVTMSSGVGNAPGGLYVWFMQSLDSIEAESDQGRDLSEWEHAAVVERLESVAFSVSGIEYAEMAKRQLEAVGYRDVSEEDDSSAYVLERDGDTTIHVVVDEDSEWNFYAEVVLSKDISPVSIREDGYALEVNGRTLTLSLR